MQLGCIVRLERVAAIAVAVMLSRKKMILLPFFGVIIYLLRYCFNALCMRGLLVRARSWV